MLNKSDYLEAHSKFYDFLLTEKASCNKYLPYGQHIILSSIADGTLWMVFHEMASDYIRELLNEINHFCSTISDLDTWDMVLKDSSDEIKYDLLIETVYPIAITSLNFPYLIRNRFIYFTTKLLNETLNHVYKNRQKIITDEKKINFKSLLNFKSLPFKNDLIISLDKLLAELSKINTEQFKDKTYEYRDRFHHRLPPKIEIGLSSMVTRKDNPDGSIAYAFGGQLPLKISDLIPVLLSEHSSCVSAFLAFWLLIEEQIRDWKAYAGNNVV